MNIVNKIAIHFKNFLTKIIVNYTVISAVLVIIPSIFGLINYFSKPPPDQKPFILKSDLKRKDIMLNLLELEKAEVALNELNQHMIDKDATILRFGIIANQNRIETVFKAIAINTWKKIQRLKKQNDFQSLYKRITYEITKAQLECNITQDGMAGKKTLNCFNKLVREEKDMKQVELAKLDLVEIETPSIWDKIIHYFKDITQQALILAAK